MYKKLKNTFEYFGVWQREKKPILLLRRKAGRRNQYFENPQNVTNQKIKYNARRRRKQSL